MSEFGTPETPSYVGMAERLRRMQEKTPDRFRRDPGERPQPWTGRKKNTVPRTPKFARDTRSSRLREMREEQKGKKKGRKAAPGTPKFATAARAKMKPVYEEEKPAQFKAQPIRRYKRVELDTSKMSTASVTSVQPFSFDRRPRTRRTPQVQQEEPKMELFHRPGEIPDLSGKFRSGRVDTKTATKAQPFNFRTEKRPKRFAFSEVTNRDTSTLRSDEKFMEKALRGHRVPKVEPQPTTVPMEPVNHLEERGKQRAAYDKAAQEQRDMREAQKEQERREQEELEAAELKRQRNNELLHKPEPIRRYKPAPERQELPLTLTNTPKAARPQNRAPRQSRRLKNMAPK